jgi:hypothetical protein
MQGNIQVCELRIKNSYFQINSSLRFNVNLIPSCYSSQIFKFVNIFKHFLTSSYTVDMSDILLSYQSYKISFVYIYF